MEEGGGIFLDFNILPEAQKTIASVLGGLSDILSKDYSEALRLCSGRDEAIQRRILKGFVEWRANLRDGERFCYEIQRLQEMENKGEIFPPSREDWRLYEYLRDNFNPEEFDEICALVRTPQDKKILATCIKTIAEGRINMPSKYIISKLKKQ